MNKKPFNADRKFEGKEGKSFRKPFDKKDDKPFRKPEGDRNNSTFRKSVGDADEGRKFKKSFEQKGDRPFKKPFESGGDKPFKKRFEDKGDSFGKKRFDRDGDKPFKKRFEDKGDSFGKKRFDSDGDKPFKKRFEDKGDSFGKKRFDRDGDKPFKKRFEDKGDSFGKKRFDRDGDKPFKKRFEDKGESFGKKRFDRDGDKPFKKRFEDKGDSFGKKRQDGDGEKPFRKKNFDKKPESPFRRTWGAEEQSEERSYKKRFSNDNKDERPYRKDKEGNEEPKKPNRYANAFGKLDDEELVAHKAKLAKQQEEKESQPEVTFSKELEDKWEEEVVEKQFGKSEVRPRKPKLDEDGEERHSKKNRFKRQFDNENDYEQVYAAAPGKKEAAEQEDEPKESLMPLNKFIAHCDICSRRDAVVLIKDGKVTVNDELVTVPGHKVTPEDVVKLNGEVLSIQKNLVYILMNKPKGFITTTDDPKGRRTVMEMVEPHIEERVFPVGRLDRNTTGLLLLTNDGELTQKLAHPKYNVRKVYKATLDKNLTGEDFDKIKAGVILEDGQAPVDELEYLDSKNEIGLEIHSGKNRIVRRIFESLGYEVEKLDRVMYAGLTKKNVLRGRWRFLTKQEVINLKHML